MSAKKRVMNRDTALDLALAAGMALSAVRLAWASHLTEDDLEALNRAMAVCGRLSDREAA